MLPVNFMSEKEAEIFKSHGVPAENILAAIRFDLDTNGNFGITWLAIDKKRKRLCRLDENNNLYDEFELDLLINPYIDNFNTSNALLAYGVHRTDYL